MSFRVLSAKSLRNHNRSFHLSNNGGGGTGNNSNTPGPFLTGGGSAKSNRSGRSFRRNTNTNNNVGGERSFRSNKIMPLIATQAAIPPGICPSVASNASGSVNGDCLSVHQDFFDTIQDEVNYLYEFKSKILQDEFIEFSHRHDHPQTSNNNASMGVNNVINNFGTSAKQHYGGIKAANKGWIGNVQTTVQKCWSGCCVSVRQIYTSLCKGNTFLFISLLLITCVLLPQAILILMNDFTHDYDSSKITDRSASPLHALLSVLTIVSIVTCAVSGWCLLYFYSLWDSLIHVINTHSYVITWLEASGFTFPNSNDIVRKGSIHSIKSVTSNNRNNVSLLGRSNSVSGMVAGSIRMLTSANSNKVEPMNSATNVMGGNTMGTVGLTTQASVSGMGAGMSTSPSAVIGASVGMNANGTTGGGTVSSTAASPPPLPKEFFPSIVCSFAKRINATTAQRSTRDICNCMFITCLQIYFICMFLRIVFDLNCNHYNHLSHSDNGTVDSVMVGEWIRELIMDMLGNNYCCSGGIYHSSTSASIAYSVSHTSGTYISSSGYHHFPQSFTPKTSFLSAYALILFLIPVIFFKGLPQTSMRCIWYNLLSTTGVFFIAICVSNCYAVIPTGLIWIAIAFFAVRDVQLRNMIIFLSTRNAKETMVSQSKALEESHANEMRHLIANVAHDLKTPLASFTTGLDFIQLAIDECEASAPSMTQLHGFHEMVSSIQTCLTNIRNTNMFMLMTINRCIDYTKVCKGIKLLPRYETIDLMDTIQLPLRCMQNIQSKVNITVSSTMFTSSPPTIPLNGMTIGPNGKALPTPICSHIITDKLWLQENLLCLLSNAVKYSTAGEVTISLRIVSVYKGGDCFADDTKKKRKKRRSAIASSGCSSDGDDEGDSDWDGEYDDCDDDDEDDNGLDYEFLIPATAAKHPVPKKLIVSANGVLSPLPTSTSPNNLSPRSVPLVASTSDHCVFPQGLAADIETGIIRSTPEETLHQPQQLHSLSMVNSSGYYESSISGHLNASSSLDVLDDDLENALSTCLHLQPEESSKASKSNGRDKEKEKERSIGRVAVMDIVDEESQTVVTVAPKVITVPKQSSIDRNEAIKAAIAAAISATEDGNSATVRGPSPTISTTASVATPAALLPSRTPSSSHPPLSHSIGGHGGGSVNKTQSSSFSTYRQNMILQGRSVPAPAGTTASFSNTETSVSLRPTSRLMHLSNASVAASMEAERSISITGNRNQPNMMSMARSYSQKRLPVPSDNADANGTSSGLNANVSTGNSGRGSVTSATPEQKLQYLVVEVEDTGIGMSDAAMEMLFNPFNQTQRLAGGTGLGLFSLAKRIEAVKGKYGVRRRRDGRQGSLFWFAIPYRPDHVMAELCSSTATNNNNTYHTDSTQMRDLPVIDTSKDKVSERPSITTTDNCTTPTGASDASACSAGTFIPKGATISDDNVATIRVDGTPVMTSLTSAESTQTSNVATPINVPSTVASVAPTASSVPDKECFNILVVDDAPAIVKMTGMMLKKLGHRVSSAENGQVAVDMVKERIQQRKDRYQQRVKELQQSMIDDTLPVSLAASTVLEGESLCFDIVLMDLQMPVMDGLEATKRIRELEYRSGGLPSDVGGIGGGINGGETEYYHHWIVGCSANSETETQEAALAIGMDIFMSKPFNVQTFFASIAHFHKMV